MIQRNRKNISPCVYVTAACPSRGIVRKDRFLCTEIAGRTNVVIRSLRSGRDPAKSVQHCSGVPADFIS
jgi:hypothetical protein